jgi:hypothetical protein
MHGNIERCSPQNFLVGKSVYQNFAKQEYEVSDGGHPGSPWKGLDLIK